MQPLEIWLRNNKYTSTKTSRGVTHNSPVVMMMMIMIMIMMMMMMVVVVVMVLLVMVVGLGVQVGMVTV